MAPIFTSSKNNSPDSSIPLTSDPNTPGPSTSSRKNRPRTCFAFNHMPNEDLNTIYYYLKTLAPKQRCRYCNQRYKLNGSTRILMNHLRQEHNIKDKSRQEISTRKRQLLIEESIAYREQHPRLRRRLNTRSYLTLKGDPLEILLIRLLASGNLPPRIVEVKEFRDLIFYLNHDANDVLPRSYLTIRDLVLTLKDTALLGAKTRLYSARSTIYLSVDVGLINANNKSVIAIVTHFLSKDGKLKTMLLSLKEIFGKHTGKNLTKLVIVAIVEQDIAKKLSYF